MGTGGSPQVFVFRLPPLDRALEKRRPFGAFMNWASCAPYDFGKRRRASELRTFVHAPCAVGKTKEKHAHSTRTHRGRVHCVRAWARSACATREGSGRRSPPFGPKRSTARALGGGARGLHLVPIAFRPPPPLPRDSVHPKEGRGRNTGRDQVKVGPWSGGQGRWKKRKQKTHPPPNDR